MKYCSVDLGKEKKIPDYTAWGNEAPLFDKLSIPNGFDKDNLTAMFYIRMLYSCLVDADYLDTESFMEEGNVFRDGNSSIEELNYKLLEYIQAWFPPKGDLNRCRCEILRSCLVGGNQNDKGYFTLTVPTGGGKTVASLAFALQHAKKNGLHRIIYVIPYTSIIEQTADVFRKILGEENVLENHSGVHLSEDADDDLNTNTIRTRKATENWDMPVIVTTAVQFFESLYSNKPSQCRKLHNIANSVIIFDEAQMMPLYYLRPCVHAISQLVENYHCSAVLCTATQPSLESIFQEFAPGCKFQELCPKEQYENPVFRRVTFWQTGIQSWQNLSDKISQQNQALCIVNSRKSAQTLYNLLDGDGVYHLSTLMTPMHRRRILQEIRTRLAAGKRCKVVSTSLIEAGVDVDFPKVYRELIGLDSILQSAGRCNREGKRNYEESVVEIFQSEENIPPLFATATDVTRKILSKYDNIAGTEAIMYYFHLFRKRKGIQEQDKKGILQLSASKLFPFETIAKEVHLIETNTYTVYIPLEKGAEYLERFRTGERSKRLFRELGQYSVSVYEQHWKELMASGDIRQLEGTDNYELINISLYSDQTGLSLDADYGKALFI